MSLENFEAIEIGDALGPEPIYLSKERSRAYAIMAGMNAPRFTDDEGARKEGLPGMIVPGNMSSGLLGKLVTNWAYPANGRLARMGVTYRAIVLPDHTITLQGFVTETDPEKRTAELDIWLENEDGDRLVIGTATVQFPPKS